MVGPTRSASQPAHQPGPAPRTRGPGRGVIIRKQRSGILQQLSVSCRRGTAVAGRRQGHDMGTPVFYRLGHLPRLDLCTGRHGGAKQLTHATSAAAAVEPGQRELPSYRRQQATPRCVYGAHPTAPRLTISANFWHCRRKWMRGLAASRPGASCSVSASAASTSPASTRSPICCRTCGRHGGRCRRGSRVCWGCFGCSVGAWRMCSGKKCRCSVASSPLGACGAAGLPVPTLSPPPHASSQGRAFSHPRTPPACPARPAA